MPGRLCSTSCRGQREDFGESSKDRGRVEGVGGLVVELTDGMGTEYTETI